MASDQAPGTNVPMAQAVDHHPQSQLLSEWNEQHSYDQFAQSTVQAYLDQHLDPTQTARTLTVPINTFLDQPPSDTDHLPSADTGALPSSTAIWTAILTLTRLVPYTSQSIPRLVSLLAALKTVPSPQNNKILPDSHQSEPFHWSSLPGFGAEVRENWNREIVDDKKEDDDNGHTCTPASLTSMNALIAQLTAAGILDFKRYAIWALRDALENPPGETNNAGRDCELDHLVPAAVVWVVYAGKVMYEEWIGAEQPGDKGGRLLPEEKGFTVKRWGFWRERFRWVAGQREVDVKEETRGMARLAVERMEGVERGVGRWRGGG
ncbi:MAG: hypothetical protein Q9209_007357 [Squamulea sp. 1 TL-2023]